MPNSSARTWATTVSGLFPQNGELSDTVNCPLCPMRTVTPSGVAVTGKPGFSYQNQNSVAL